MRIRLAKLGTIVASLVASAAGVHAQEQFPGLSYITPFPAGDTYRMQVYGDAFGEGLLAGLADAFASESRVRLQRRRRPLAGIMRSDFEDELKAEAASKDTVHIAVVMLGYNDRYPFRLSAREVVPPGSPAWRAEYGRRVDRLAKTLRRRGAAVYWVGLPLMRRPEVNEPAQAINEVVREKAYLNGIKFIDITTHFADEAGNYTPYGPDVAGKQRVVRQKDGVLFTWAGYRKLAYFVEREIKRDLASARAERSIPLAGSEAEQKRIAALRPRQPGAGGKGGSGAAKGEAGKDKGKTLVKARAGPFEASTDTKADNGRLLLKTVAPGGREETVTLELPRPAIPAAVVRLITRRDTGERASAMGETLADDVGGGLVLLSSITPVAGAGLGRKAAPGPYYQVWLKGERMTPKPGRSDDFSWPRAHAEEAGEAPDLSTPSPKAKAKPRG
jgi:hypothetical protein